MEDRKVIPIHFKLTLYSIFVLVFAFAATAQDADESEVLPIETETEVVEDWTVHYDNGVKAYDLGDYAMALSHFGRAELESSESEKIHYNMGLAHLKLDEYDLAKDEFTKALSSPENILKLKAKYNLGHLHYKKALVKTTDAGEIEFEKEELGESVKYFRDIISTLKYDKIKSSSEAIKLAEDAKRNERIIVTKLKLLSDAQAKKKGGKVPFIQGTVQLNGRPIDNAFIYMKSKWEDNILGHSYSDPSGMFKIDELDTGKYELAGSLYEIKDIKEAKFGEPIRVPTFKEDNHDLKINGILSHGCPYQSSANSLDVPYNDSRRASGPESITRSTDWGELTDGRPMDYFPKDNDIDAGYVAFAEPVFQIAMGLPQKAQQQNMQQIQQTTAPSEKPKFSVTLKGFHDNQEAVLPSQFQVYGMKKDLDKPVKLYETIVKTTQNGLYEWKSDEFEYQECRNLIFAFSRLGGKRVSLHEIEVFENDPNQQKQDPQENQDKQEEQQDQQNDQDQQQDQQNEQEQQQKKEKVSRPTENILSKLKKKNEDEKKKKAKLIRANIQTKRDY